MKCYVQVCDESAAGHHLLHRQSGSGAEQSRSAGPGRAQPQSGPTEAAEGAVHHQAAAQDPAHSFRRGEGQRRAVAASRRASRSEKCALQIHLPALLPHIPHQLPGLSQKSGIQLFAQFFFLGAACGPTGGLG